MSVTTTVEFCKVLLQCILTQT